MAAAPIIAPGTNPIRVRAHVGTKPWFIFTKKQMLEGLESREDIPIAVREALIARVEREMPDDGDS